jgi:hypothetical protein
VRFEKHIVFLLDMEQIIASMNPKLSLEHHSEGVEESIGMGHTILIADDCSHPPDNRQIARKGRFFRYQNNLRPRGVGRTGKNQESRRRGRHAADRLC